MRGKVAKVHQMPTGSLTFGPLAIAHYQTGRARPVDDRIRRCAHSRSLLSATDGAGCGFALSSRNG
jgi:hypothetical protein